MAARASRPLGPLQHRLLERLAMPTTKLGVTLDAQGSVTSASVLFDAGTVCRSPPLSTPHAYEP